MDYRTTARLSSSKVWAFLYGVPQGQTPEIRHLREKRKCIVTESNPILSSHPLICWLALIFSMEFSEVEGMREGVSACAGHDVLMF